MALLSPTPSRPRMKREIFTSPTCLGLADSDLFDLTPADSGYGSSFTTPKRPQFNGPLHTPLPKYTQFPLLDGNGSPDNHSPSSNDSDYTDDDGDVFTATPAKNKDAAPKQRARSATMPQRGSLPRPTLPASFYSEGSSRTTKAGSGVRARRLKNYSVRIPDRFIPRRDSMIPIGDVFRVTKPVKKLSAVEKLRRDDSATPDPFVFRRPLVSPMASGHRQHVRSDTRAVRNGVRTTLVTLPLSSNSNNVPIERQVGATVRYYHYDRDLALALQRSLEYLTSDLYQVSHGSVWTVGGTAPSGTAVNNGRGHLVQTGTNARMFRTNYSTVKLKLAEEIEKHRDRLATALNIDQTQRIFGFDKNEKAINRNKVNRLSLLMPQKTYWDGSQWKNENPIPKPPKAPESRNLPKKPFKVLNAPDLKDDFYCSLLAYSPNCHTLVAGLGNLLYAWSEEGGVRLLSGGMRDNAYLTSVAFSSTQGCKAILAYGRSNCILSLMSLYDIQEPIGDAQLPLVLPRFEIRHPHLIQSVRWRPTYKMRRSQNPHNTNPRGLAKMEDLLVGNEVGTIYYYQVEWPERWEVARNDWQGSIILMAVIKVHYQQVCGLSWSPNGELFASGGNDNNCFLFETSKIESKWLRAVRNANRAAGLDSSDGSEATVSRPSQIIVKAVEIWPGDEKQKWTHAAAVKAIAFCPWQDSLIATGGGSSDKCIHFYHTCSGAALATISVSAQVTSLIWSNTRREICATFGYAEPDHPYRIALFSWPDCRQVGAIKWSGGHRALYAIPYPGGAPDWTGTSPNSEGSIVVASSDRSVKFHEVWATNKKPASGGIGMLSGSDILENIQGIDKEGDVIR